MSLPQARAPWAAAPKMHAADSLLYDIERSGAGIAAIASPRGLGTPGTPARAALAPLPLDRRSPAAIRLIPALGEGRSGSVHRSYIGYRAIRRCDRGDRVSERPGHAGHAGPSRAGAPATRSPLTSRHPPHTCTWEGDCASADGSIMQEYGERTRDARLGRGKNLASRCGLLALAARAAYAAGAGMLGAMLAVELRCRTVYRPGWGDHALPSVEGRAIGHNGRWRVSGEAPLPQCPSRASRR